MSTRLCSIRFSPEFVQQHVKTFESLGFIYALAANHIVPTGCGLKKAQPLGDPIVKAMEILTIFEELTGHPETDLNTGKINEKPFERTDP